MARFGVSLSRSLLKALDRIVRQKGYRSRSLALSDMFRDQRIARRQERRHGEAVGTLTVIYDHHRPHVQETLTDL